MSEIKKGAEIKVTPSRMVIEVTDSMMVLGRYELNIHILADKQYNLIRILPHDFYKTSWDYFWEIAKRELEEAIFKT